MSDHRPQTAALCSGSSRNRQPEPGSAPVPPTRQTRGPPPTVTMVSMATAVWWLLSRLRLFFVVTNERIPILSLLSALIVTKKRIGTSSAP